jgi:hypothetical protein
MREGAMTCEAYQIPVNECKVESGRVSDEDRLCGSVLSHATYSRRHCCKNCQ